MRWQGPKDHTRRVRRWFAWWPVTIRQETRWLERVAVQQQYSTFLSGGGGYWRNQDFVDERQAT
jgi:hypothetical protein